MARYFAEVDAQNVVLRVIVAESADWCVDHLGGTWVETADPYSQEPQAVTYCGPGYGCDESFPERFAPQWRQPLGADVEEAPPYEKDAVVFHGGRIWRSTVDVNVWEPGVSGWHDVPLSGTPIWVQPAGAHDAYQTGDVVQYNGDTWRSTTPNNVWAPGVFGWVIV